MMRASIMATKEQSVMLWKSTSPPVRPWESKYTRGEQKSSVVSYLFLLKATKYFKFQVIFRNFQSTNAMYSPMRKDFENITSTATDIIA